MSQFSDIKNYFIKNGIDEGFANRVLKFIDDNLSNFPRVPPFKCTAWGSSNTIAVVWDTAFHHVDLDFQMTSNTIEVFYRNRKSGKIDLFYMEMNEEMPKDVMKVFKNIQKR